MLQGFAAALLSYDGGGHWVGVPGTAGAGEHSVVSFAPTPTTRQAPLLLAAPVGRVATIVSIVSIVPIVRLWSIVSIVHSPAPPPPPQFL